MNRQVFYLCRGMFKESVSSPRIWCGYLIGLAGVFYSVYPYIKYTQEAIINVLEPFIILLSERSFVTYILLGYFLIICNAPFINSRTELSILRTTRLRWMDSMYLYVCMQTLIYYIFIFGAATVMAIPAGYFGNMWSKMIYMISSYQPAAALNAGVFVPPVTFLQNWSVFEACIHSFLLIFFYSLLIALILFAGNLIIYKLAGSICAVIIHFIGYLIISDSIFFKTKYSFLANGMLSLHEPTDIRTPTIGFSYALFIFCTVFLYFVLHFAAEKCDLKKAISEQT